MKRIGVRIYTFQELMNRLDSDYWKVHRYGIDVYVFVPAHQMGRVDE